MGASKRWGIGGVMAVALAVPLVMASAAAAAPISFTVDLSWGTTTPACVGDVVCAGIGTKTFQSGVPATEADQSTSLVLSQLPSIVQPDALPVPIGSLEYCNGQTFSTTDITSVNLLAAFDVPGSGTGNATDVVTLIITENSADPVASADSLFLATDPGKKFTVLENECAAITLLGKVTTAPDLVVTLGPVITGGEQTTTTSTTTSTSSTTTTTSTTLPSSTTSTTTTLPSSTTTTLTPGSTTTTTTARGNCLAAYFFKCAPDARADWNCPDATSDALPSDWANVAVDSSLPAAEQDPWGLDGPIGSATSGTSGVGCESSSVLSASQSNSTGGSSVSGLAVTGAAKTGALALLAIGLVLFGMSAVTSDAGRRWITTSDPAVRYTIDRRRPRR